MKKLLITGADGMLATDLTRYFQTHSQYDIIKASRKDLDITSRDMVEEMFNMHKPDYIIHTAAITNVDFCEDNIDEAMRVNGYGTENIGVCAEQINAKVIYISSCGLFGDELKPYDEKEPVVLKTEYAKSKYLGEAKIAQSCSRHFIVRPGWLFGGGIQHKKNFVYNRYKEAIKGDEMVAAGDKYGCPTYTYHLAGALMSLLDTEKYGVYHISNDGSASRYDYVKKIITCFGLKTKVKKVDSSSFPRKAPVPDCEIISNYNLKKNGFSLLPSWELAIEDYVNILKNEIE
ncbi:UNVERIFIED_CONTAM: dTDP-4-dehydrorhamnose reductase [Acetivibrio alkalicellulosi]